MVNNYVTFDDVLKNPCKKVSVEEGKKIAVELINKLVKDKNAIGLAANQVGIDASVAVVNVIEPIIIINPRIINIRIFRTSTYLIKDFESALSIVSKISVLDIHRFSTPCPFCP